MTLTQELFAWASVAGGVTVVAAGALFRSRSYAMFRAVMLTIHGLVATAMLGYVAEAQPLLVWPYAYLHACVYVQSIRLVWPDMRSLPYRALVSLPDAFFQGASMLALPWAIARGLGYPLPLFWLPYLLGVMGLIQALTSRKEQVHLVVADAPASDRVARHPRGEQRVERPLKIVQITDPHLGAFMSVARLRGICERAVALEPDLVVLTGDFLTMESQRDKTVLARALEPLKQLPGRVIGCMGNHDLEAPATVKHAFETIGAPLLIDDAIELSTEAGPVQVLGADFKWRARAEHLTALCAAHPRARGALRIVLLHDPGAFKHLPEGEADLVLSGHTHGGQMGLVSLGLPGTMVSALSSSPDHGFWARGRDRLYVHRGTGHYGYPLRLGVPAEESLLLVHKVQA